MEFFRELIVKAIFIYFRLYLISGADGCLPLLQTMKCLNEKKNGIKQRNNLKPQPRTKLVETNQKRVLISSLPGMETQS